MKNSIYSDILEKTRYPQLSNTIELEFHQKHYVLSFENKSLKKL